MKLTNRMWVACIGLFIFSAVEVKAETSGNLSQTTADSAVFDQSKPHTLYLSAAVNQGVSSLSSSGSGLQTEILGIATLELRNWAFEAGGGWLYSNISGNPSGSAASSQLSLSAFSMTTEAGVAELSPQYKITEHLQAGLLGEALFGPNVGFDYNIGGSEQSLAFMGGAQALYGFQVGPIDLRAGARYLTSLNISDQRLQTIQATLQFGLPVL